MCPNMRPVGVAKKRKKRTETFMRQTGYLPRPPTSTLAPEILCAGSCPGNSYIFQVSWKSVQGSPSCGGRKSPSPIDLAHGLYNSLYYRTSRDVNATKCNRIRFYSRATLSCLGHFQFAFAISCHVFYNVHACIVSHSCKLQAAVMQHTVLEVEEVVVII